MRYHNITPPEFFRGYSEEAAARTASGLREMQMIARAFPYGIADSDFNRQDMRKLGFRCPIDVCPIVIPFSDTAKNGRKVAKLLSQKTGLEVEDNSADQ